MSESFSIKAIINLVVYGFPALLLVVGAFFYFSGYTIQTVTGESGMMNLGIVLMALGIVLYVIEFIIKVYAYFSES